LYTPLISTYTAENTTIMIIARVNLMANSLIALIAIRT
jgi:hypothetical protein